jgi:hypothetical protein
MTFTPGDTMGLRSRNRSLASRDEMETLTSGSGRGGWKSACVTGNSLAAYSTAIQEATARAD